MEHSSSLKGFQILNIQWEIKWNIPFHCKIFKCCQMVNTHSFSLFIANLYCSIWHKGKRFVSERLQDPRITEFGYSRVNSYHKDLWPKAFVLPSRPVPCLLSRAKYRKTQAHSLAPGHYSFLKVSNAECPW